MARIDPLLYSYQTAISSLMENQQVALAAFLAASAMAHLPIQPAISPLESPKLPPNLGVSVRPRHRRAVRMLPVGQVEQQQQLYRQRLRFILEGQAQQCHARVERVESRGEMVPSTPSAAEMQLPWKRDDDDDMGMFPVKQSEFPLWVENKEYTNYYSPTNTFLGGLDRKDGHPSVIGMFGKGNESKSSVEESSDAPSSPPSSCIVTVTIPEEDTIIEKPDEEEEEEEEEEAEETAASRFKV